jgi:two-component system chemotaxis response regulator CheY
MIDLEDELARDYLAECREQLSSVEADLIALQEGAPEGKGEFVNGVFQALHWIQGGAADFDLAKIAALAHQAEDALSPIRSGAAPATSDRIGVLLRATDKLRELIQNPAASNQADITGILAELRGKRGAQQAVRQRALRVLLVEDDFSSRLVLQTFLTGYGECHMAVNGREAVEAFRTALEHGQRYDLILMDIMMPEMDGREAMRQIRALEEEFGILSTSGAKIIMTTAVDEVKEVVRCFHELCDSYLTKPIELAALVEQMKAHGLLSAS